MACLLCSLKHLALRSDAPVPSYMRRREFITL
jgi:hypothetical protein